MQRRETPEHLTVLLQLLMTNASKYSKGLLSEILEFVMGNGMIPGAVTHCSQARSLYLTAPSGKPFVACYRTWCSRVGEHATKDFAEACLCT